MPLGEHASNFNLEKAICNHGLFMMAPNCWNPSNKSFQRPLRLTNATDSVNVSVSHPTGQDFLVIHVYDVEILSSEDRRTIMNQIVRMLRISNKDESDLREFHAIHAEAKHQGFGRLFRSPSLFEDIIKSILLCNTTKVENGKINLHKYEEEGVSCELLYKSLKDNKGFGPFVCANILFCIGIYEKVPTDSETIRHLKEVHSRESCDAKTVDKDVKEIYDKYAPFQCLAFWMELLESYEKKCGKLSELDNSQYHIVTGNIKL
ncbi:hypothetical protein Pint_30882 [Pistacia integerrima]|uniref:Uncharacterized protein n=1 Tax=Pistacia integerrima TaxID=434235 RepID=A0ACC0XNB0_9ROSI|nr:hypothetical protein Pint_30882 [Pistacia integerrima]